MVVQYSLVLCESISIAFVDQPDDVKMMFLKVCVQGDDPFSMSLNPHIVARRDLRLVLYLRDLQLQASDHSAHSSPELSCLGQFLDVIRHFDDGTTT